jgi:hypothetical protein
MEMKEKWEKTPWYVRLFGYKKFRIIVGWNDCPPAQFADEPFSTPIYAYSDSPDIRNMREPT